MMLGTLSKSSGQRFTYRINASLGFGSEFILNS